MGHNYDELDEMTVQVTVPVAKIARYNEMLEILSSAIWLLKECEKMKKRYPHGKNYQKNYENALEHVSKVNEVLTRTRVEISEQLKKNINHGLSGFFPF